MCSSRNEDNKILRKAIIHSFLQVTTDLLKGLTVVTSFSLIIDSFI